MLQPSYLDKHLIAHDPFISVDVHGVGGMIQMAVRRCRRSKPSIKVIQCVWCCDILVQ